MGLGGKRMASLEEGHVALTRRERSSRGMASAVWDTCASARDIGATLLSGVWFDAKRPHRQGREQSSAGCCEANSTSRLRSRSPRRRPPHRTKPCRPRCHQRHPRQILSVRGRGGLACPCLVLHSGTGEVSGGDCGGGVTGRASPGGGARHAGAPSFAQPAIHRSFRRKGPPALADF